MKSFDEALQEYKEIKQGIREYRSEIEYVDSLELPNYVERWVLKGPAKHGIRKLMKRRKALFKECPELKDRLVVSCLDRIVRKYTVE